MQMADRFGIPVISLVDTPEAYPGIEAEERGQAEAIARSTETCLALGVPNVAVIVRRKAALATPSRSPPQAGCSCWSHAIYSVISPEGAASILWRDTAKAQDAATGMKITAQDMIRFGVIDQIVTEPIGGAHRDPAVAIASADSAILDASSRSTGPRPEAVLAASAGTSSWRWAARWGEACRIFRSRNYPSLP